MHLLDHRQALLRQLPSVDIVLKQPQSEQLQRKYGRQPVVSCLRTLLDEWRGRLQRGEWQEAELQIAMANLFSQLSVQIESSLRPSLHPVINATGVIIHTNLGRSLLAEQAKQQMLGIASNYSTLEMDIASGERGSRYSHVHDLLLELTGAEDAIVVNNNAGAVVLALAALTAGRQVVVSRGQLVEIGGSFRIPEVMEQSGCRLVEVGTTNKTHLRDYARAITADTAALLKVHTSNYQIIGFNQSVAGRDMAELAHEHGLLAIEDLGSGVLIDLVPLGYPHEPTVLESLASGMDVVTFSGDKLLGGPQAGIAVGKGEAISRLRQHPLNRALRIDKLTLAALEATLRLYRDGQQAIEQIPTLRMLAAAVPTLRIRAERMAVALTDQLSQQAQVQVVDSFAQVGGGSLPGHDIPSVALAISPDHTSVDRLESSLRWGEPAVFGRIQQQRVLLDLRTIQPEEDPVVVAALVRALGGNR